VELYFDNNIKFKGEPDTINMGGEPGDDVGSNEGAAPNSFSTVVADLSAFKTPPQLRTDADDEIGEEQPTIGQKQHLMHFSQINIESEIANKSKEIGIFQQQLQTKTTANNNKITLKLPNLQSNFVQFFEYFSLYFSCDIFYHMI
jgi:hypothetical protein